mmetsp:Transcript_37066/g.116621  ORF Transcript_37066/g.116621 Transcript_37066/m.116621 type:complete len:91 (+) Transcript_37066:144-416(+)
MSSGGALPRLWVTLRRGLAGKKKTQLATISALGLRWPHQTIVKNNTADIRGQLYKVKHLVEVEFEHDALRKIEETKARLATREPLVVKHG